MKKLMVVCVGLLAACSSGPTEDASETDQGELQVSAANAELQKALGTAAGATVSTPGSDAVGVGLDRKLKKLFGAIQIATGPAPACAAESKSINFDGPDISHIAQLTFRCGRGVLKSTGQPWRTAQGKTVTSVDVAVDESVVASVAAEPRTWGDVVAPFGGVVLTELSREQVKDLGPRPSALISALKLDQTVDSSLTKPTGSATVSVAFTRMGDTWHYIDVFVNQSNPSDSRGVVSSVFPLDQSFSEDGVMKLDARPIIAAMP